ncbi:MAG: hypothetical protein KDD69_13335 [Bdellovibrionales bacterium]|nr:hypothetical protein [Bdellovibrionales bacterium]
MAETKETASEEQVAVPAENVSGDADQDDVDAVLSQMGVADEPASDVGEAEEVTSAEFEAQANDFAETAGQAEDAVERAKLDPEVRDALSSANETLDRARVAVMNAERTAGVQTSREVPVSAVVHLLGLSTSAQVTVLESTLDLIMTRLNSLTHKVDRLSTLIEASHNQSLLDRFDYQLSDIKSILKKVLPHTVTTIAEDKEKKASKSESKVMTSVPAAAEATDAATKAQAAPKDDSDFQKAEADRIRSQMAARRE